MDSARRNSGGSGSVDTSCSLAFSRQLGRCRCVGTRRSLDDRDASDVTVVAGAGIDLLI